MNRFSKSTANFLGYLKYRIAAEWEYQAHNSPTAEALRRQWSWWRYRFPEYVWPSSLPDPEGTPLKAPGALAPAEGLRRSGLVLRMHCDNILLFGHTLPTSEEVAFRKSYLAWFESRMKYGSLEALPVEQIERDARNTRVPAYDFPFVHERVWRELAEGRRLPGLGGVDCDGDAWSWRDWEHDRDSEGRLVVRRAQQLYFEALDAHDVDGDADADAASRAGAADARDAAEAVREAKEDLREAAADVQDMLRTGFRASSDLQPQLLAFARGRIQTFSEALAEFSAGYSEGSREVETGKMDPKKDFMQFWDQMVHQVPAFLDTQSRSPSRRIDKSKSESRDQPQVGAATGSNTAAPSKEAT